MPNLGPGPGPGPGPRLEAGSRGRVGSGSEVGVGSEVGTEAGRRVRSGFGSKATFSELWHSEMRFFKTHGFHKPLLREMLFLLGGGDVIVLSRAQTAIEIDEP